MGDAPKDDVDLQPLPPFCLYCFQQCLLTALCVSPTHHRPLIPCRPHQHSASWWPRLFADDVTDVAWDDAPKDYTDLPPAIAAAAAAEAAREDEVRRQQEQRRDAKERLQVDV